MNLVSLVTHGLSAMAVFGDRIAVRLLVLMSAVVVSGVLALTLVGIISGFDVGTLWSDPLVGIVAALVLQLLLLLLVFVFLVLGARSETAFVPARDYALYVRELRAVR